MTLLQRADDGAEETLTGFEFQRGELEEVSRGITYQQATSEGYVCMAEHRGDVDVSFRSREAGKSRVCTIGSGELATLLNALWASG